MRINRLVAGLVTTGLVGVTPVLIAAAPAQAATIGSVVSVDALDADESSIEYGKTEFFSGTVKGADGSSASTGTVTLLVSTPAVPTFTPVATDDTASYWSFSDIKPEMNSTYKVSYSGGTSGYGSSANTLTPSESGPVAISVSRSFKLKTKGLRVIGRVVPDFAKGKITVLQVLNKKGTKTKKYAKVKTNKKSHFQFKAPNKVGFSFILVVKADSEYAGTYAPYHVI